MTTQERADFWQQQITAWLASGLSGHAFCKSQALVYHGEAKRSAASVEIRF